MRSILNISLPPEKRIIIQKRAKKTNKSVSAYILYAVQLEQNLIQEDEVLAMAEKAVKDYRAGKTKKLKNLENFMD
jgi:uncharacterized protein (DUF1778 family)